MRVSDDMRESVASLLTTRCGEGYLSLDTLAHRIELVYRTQSVARLMSLTRDVPAQTTWWRRARDGVSRSVALITHRQLYPLEIDAHRDLDLSSLLNPPAPLVVGRDGSQCDIVIDHATISRRHAEFLPLSFACSVRDLSSSNGTWLGQQPIRHAWCSRGAMVILGQLAITLDWG